MGKEDKKSDDECPGGNKTCKNCRKAYDDTKFSEIEENPCAESVCSACNCCPGN